MNCIFLIDIGFTLAFLIALLYAIRIKNHHVDALSRLFLCLSLGIYVAVGFSNILEHGNFTVYFDLYEDYLETLFAPFFLFFLFSLLFHRELAKRQAAEEKLTRHRDQLEEEVRIRTQELEQANQTLVAENKERQRAQKIANSFNRIFEESLNEIYIFDSVDLHFIKVNRGARENLGYSHEELTNLTPLDLKAHYTAETFEEILAPLRNGQMEMVQFFTVHQRKDGSLYPVDIHLQLSPYAEKLVFVAIVLDISLRKQLEEELRQSQKMEAIGTLAGGVAHDFNNILYAIQGFAEISQMETDPGSPIHTSLDEIVKASKRAANLVRQILTFSRKSEPIARPIRLQNILQESMKLLRGSIPSTIAIRQEIAENCGAIHADATQIHQVIINLCTNAYQAMRSTGGTLTISLKETDIAEPKAKGLQDILPGKYACLTIHDTGLGMARETLERAFEPYFTTKNLGEGTGLGLATVHGIVKGHHGAINILSSPGEETTCEVYLPIISNQNIQPESGQEQSLSPISGHILFVDDEEVITRLGKRFLEKIGCTVTTVNDSLLALQLFQKNPEKFAAVITDQTMPNLTGDELIKQLRDIRPDLPAILTTGYSETMNRETAKELGINEFLMKPLSIHELSKALGHIIKTKAA